MSTSSELIPLPVTAVTCTEDRAHVERATVLDLKAGTQRLRLGPVSALAVDRTLHAELTAGHPATVLDARIVRSWTPRGPGPADDDSALRLTGTGLRENGMLQGGYQNSKPESAASGAGPRLLRNAQAEKDEPQPHVVDAFGFLMTNCAPSMFS